MSYTFSPASPARLGQRVEITHPGSFLRGQRGTVLELTADKAEYIVRLDLADTEPAANVALFVLEYPARELAFV